MMISLRAWDLGRGPLLAIGHWALLVSCSPLRQQRTCDARGARRGKRSWRIAWNGKELHDRRTVHGAKNCRAAAHRRGERKHKTDRFGLSKVVRRSKITLTQPSPGIPGEGGKNGSGPQFPAIRPRPTFGDMGVSTLIERPKNVRKRKKRKVDRGFQGVRGGRLTFPFL